MLKRLHSIQHKHRFQKSQSVLDLMTSLALKSQSKMNLLQIQKSNLQVLKKLHQKFPTNNHKQHQKEMSQTLQQHLKNLSRKRLSGSSLAHPEDKILGKKEDPIRTRSTFRNSEEYLMGLVSLIEPTSIDNTLLDNDWILSMQEKLN